jgi:hypothetical protein
MSCCKVIEPGDTIRVADFRDDDFQRTGKVTAVEDAQAQCAAKGLPYYGEPGTIVVTFRIPRKHHERTLASQFVEKVCEHES